MLRAALPLLFVIAFPAVAQEGPAFDCTKAESSAEELVCADSALAQLDRKVSERFAEALAAAGALDSGAAQAVDDLRAYQRGWIGGRDECWKADDLRACVEAAYLTREGELVARWMLEEPTGTAVWTCDGSPANEVVTQFFDTELPSVRFERGDDIDTGALTRTASGARYIGSFGREIWIKGEEAKYRDPDPGGASYRCVLSTPD